ncbi:hypothetical protein Rhe02_52100 [Rhizocola hellebori]|uniref:Protein kinase domain-containing protein n=1 Tax=Rhizocola hellebori TaxID=1392758 RepID=A0A8J3QAD6_9ACTN|nr:serine/threonine-protein kinase [Rhizocola hellebori]GIH07143.1 hypothetical protein Rhe02_52100 [Rhizocola hellebori]
MGGDVQALDDHDPRTVGGYRVLGRLGEGGMGRVYYGLSQCSRPLAIKVIRPEFAAVADFRARFTREINAVRTVGGFWTASIVDADADAAAPWLATEFIAGPTLQAAASAQPLDQATCRALLVRLAEALQSIHDAHLIHRDLKPGNVILAADGPRVIDFGIARAFVDPQHTRTATIGTAAYMSPEQIRGGALGPASDMFALGATIAYAGTGHGPFDHHSVETTIYRVLSEPPDLHGIPAELRSLLGRCLDKDPAARPTPRQVIAEVPGGAAAVLTPFGDWRPPAHPDLSTMPVASPAPAGTETLAPTAGHTGSPAGTGTSIDPLQLTAPDTGVTLGAPADERETAHAPAQTNTTNAEQSRPTGIVWLLRSMLLLQVAVVFAVLARQVQTSSMIIGGAVPGVDTSRPALHLNQHGIQDAVLILFGLCTAALIAIAAWMQQRRHSNGIHTYGASTAAVLGLIAAGYLVNGFDIATHMVTRLTNRGQWLAEKLYLDSAMPWYTVSTGVATTAIVAIAGVGLYRWLREG